MPIGVHGESGGVRVTLPAPERSREFYATNKNTGGTKLRLFNGASGIGMDLHGGHICSVSVVRVSLEALSSCRGAVSRQAIVNCDGYC